MNNNSGVEDDAARPRKDEERAQGGAGDGATEVAGPVGEKSSARSSNQESKGQPLGQACSESVGSGEKSALKGQGQQVKKGGKNQNTLGPQGSHVGSTNSANKKVEKERAGQKQQMAEEGGSHVAEAAEAKAVQPVQARVQDGQEKSQYQKQLQKNKQIVSSLADLKVKEEGKSSSPLSHVEPINSSAKLLLQTPGKKDEEAAQRNLPLISSQQATSNIIGKSKGSGSGCLNNPEERDASATSGVQAKASACGASSAEKSMNKRDKKFMRKVQQHQHSILKEPNQGKAQNAAIEGEPEKIGSAGAASHQSAAQAKSPPQSQGTNQHGSPEKVTANAEVRRASAQQRAAQTTSSAKAPPDAETANDVDKNTDMQIMDGQAAGKKVNGAAVEGAFPVPAQLSIEDKVREAIPKMKSTIAEKFDQVDGACEYFFILERENEKVQDQIQQMQIQKKVMEKEQALQSAPQSLKTCQELQAKIEELQKTLHEMPKGYPQKYMYKYPKIDALRCQTQVDPNEYKGSIGMYLADHLGKNQAVEAAAQQLRVYSNQRIAIRKGFGQGQEGAEQPTESTGRPRLAMRKRRSKRSRSEEIETLKFENGEDAESSSESEFEKQIPNLKTAKKDTFKFESYNQRKIQRRDELQAPCALKQEPKMLFLSDQNGSKYTAEQLDEYLKFCDTIMRDTPVQGGYCGIWLRGSSMYHENAMKLLHLYDYNFDLAKFHALYPMVMNDPRKRQEMQEIAKNYPIELAKEVANAIIDLQGCKAEEVNEILQNFRNDLQNRINEDRLKYHLAILAKIKIATPPDIEQKIADSLEFSRLLRRKWAGSTRTATNIPQERKLKLSELVDLCGSQKSYCYITQEMIVLEQQLAKARHWAELVESIRGREVQLRTIEQIYQDGKNIPVNFQELMNEVKARKTQAEQLDQRIKVEIALRRTRREANVGTTRKPGKRSAASNAPGPEDMANEDSQEGGACGQPDKEQIFRDLLEEARKAKLQSDSIQKLQTKVNEIDKWKAEVKGLFQNREEEEVNYKRYREHYRGLLARSQGFHIELSLMKNLQKKCHLIDWRDRVEETWKKVDGGVRMTLEQLEHVLDDGRERLFLAKDGKGAYTISQYVRNYHPSFSWPENHTNDVAPSQEQPEKLRILVPLIQNFQSLDLLIAIHHEASQFDKVIRTILKKFRGAQGESSSSAEDASMSNGGVQAAGQATGAAGTSTEAQAAGERGARTSTGEAALGLSTVFENVDSKNRIQFSYLEELESKGLKMRVEIDKFKEFHAKLKEIRDVAQHCQTLMQKTGEAGQVQDGVFRITSESGLRDVIEARKSFLSLNVISSDFLEFQKSFQPYIFWINKSVETIKTYCRALGLKQNQLNLFDTIQDSESSDSESELEVQAEDQKEQLALRSRPAHQQSSVNPFDLEMDYQSLKALCAELVPPGTTPAGEDVEMDQGVPTEAGAPRGESLDGIRGLGKFLFFRETNHGKYLLQILSKTNALIEDFHKMKEQKRTENFDLNAYFKLLENFYNCGLPVEQSVIEEAKAELKREKWIKKYNDIQTVGNQKLQASSSQQQNSQGLVNDQSQSASGKQQKPLKQKRMVLQPNAPSVPEGSLQNERSPSPKSQGSAQSKNIPDQQQQTAKQQAAQGQNAANTASTPPPGASSTGHIRIKNLEVLIKEFQTSPEINQDETCQKMAERLQEQQRNCQNWLDKFQKIFNAVGQFDPKGGLGQVRELLEEGDHLELKLKELHELQIHQRDLNEWKRVTARIFDQTHASGEPVTLEQLEKHIKDTIDITEGANPKYIQLLQALKDLATIWKIKARTILKIRPNETMHSHQATSFQQRQLTAKGEDHGDNVAMQGTSMSDSQIQQYEAPIDCKNEKAEQSQPGLSGGEGVAQQQSQHDGEWAGDANGESYQQQQTALMANQEWREQEQDLFCICRQPENGSLMLCCDFCDMWYHYTCIGLPQDLKLLEKVKYKCIGCAIREGRFTYGLPPTAGAGSDPCNALLDPQGHAGLYSPVMPNRLQVLRELEQDKHVGHKLFMSRPSGDSVAPLIHTNLQAEASQEQQACQQEIEKLLLEHFFSKGRVQLEQFQQVLREGRESIPLKLEELSDLTLIDLRIKAWRERAGKAIKTGPMAQKLWLNFQKINDTADAKESDVIALQEWERLKDQELVDILVESESFPVLLYEAKKVVQILHFRDWLRECFQLLYQFNSSLPKVNKIKLRKHIKRLALKADVIICLAPELIKYKMKAGKSDAKNSSAQQEGSSSAQQDSLAQYQEMVVELKASSEVEANAVYMSWLLSNLSATGASAKPDVADKLGEEQAGFNWHVDWRKDLKTQVKFWDKSMSEAEQGDDEACKANAAAEENAIEQPQLFSRTPSPQKEEFDGPKATALLDSEGAAGPAALPTAKQRPGLGIVEINIEEEAENELRPPTSADEKVAGLEEQHEREPTVIPPAESGTVLLELPMEAAETSPAPREALATGLLAYEAVDGAYSGNIGPSGAAAAQLAGFIEPSPNQGRSQPQTFQENVVEMGLQNQHGLLHIIHGQHFVQNAGEQELQQPQGLGTSVQPAGLLPSLHMTLHDQNIGQQHPQEPLTNQAEQRPQLNHAPSSLVNDQMAPLQTLSGIEAIAVDQNGDDINGEALAPPVQSTQVLQQPASQSPQTLGGAPIGRQQQDSIAAGPGSAGHIPSGPVDHSLQAPDLGVHAPAQATLPRLATQQPIPPQLPSQLLHPLPTSASPLSTLAELVLRIIEHEKIIEQNLQPSAHREDSAGAQLPNVPLAGGNATAGVGSGTQDAEALQGGRVVNVWIQHAREHLDQAEAMIAAAGQGQGVHTSLMQIGELDAETVRFIKEAEGLLKLLE